MEKQPILWGQFTKDYLRPDRAACLRGGPGGPPADRGQRGQLGCTVDYTVISQWASGFDVQIAITNNGPALTSWDLQYAYAGSQQLNSGWFATWSQTGQNVTASKASWNGSLGTGASVTIGALFSLSGTNTAPTAFTLNGTACNGAGTPSPTATTTPTTGPTPPIPPIGGLTVSLTSPAANDEVPSGSTLTLAADANGGGETARSRPSRSTRSTTARVAAPPSR
jgi:endoglucanase